MRPGENHSAPVLVVPYAELAEALPGKGKMARWCPVCREGLLMVTRNPTTLRIEEHDSCLLCGQHFRYSDVADMRAGDWAEHAE
jgi:hypothetical protein